MTTDARCVGPHASLVEAAYLMRQLNVGAVPVCDNNRLAGMLTDRDITVRVVADGRDPSRTTVRDAMSPGIVYVYDDQNVDEAAHVMEEHQIRRLPVLNRDKRLVGIVSLGDVAVQTSARLSGEALKEVSQPSDRSRSV
ncbi:MAG TPA: CBS domain-containing protein [Opitutaceae bacterium]